VTGLTNGTGYIFRVAAVNSVGTGSYSANSGTVTPGTSVSFNVAANQTVTDTILRTGSVQLVKQGLGVLVLTKANSHSGGMIIESGRLVVRNSAALGIGQLIVRAGATVTIDLPGAELSVGSLVIEDGGLIDVGNGRISIPAGGYSLGQVSDLLKKGYAANWAGVSGMGSGMARSDAGRSLGYYVDGGGSITFGFAAPGDSNLDGVIDILDIGDILSAGKFNTGEPANWTQGDTNYDNVFDIVDLADILGTGLFNEGTYLTQASASSAAVETGTVATFDSALVFAAFAMETGDQPVAKRKSF
jgi:fibronectin-binding autotransporter adhesin